MYVYLAEHEAYDYHGSVALLGVFFNEEKAFQWLRLRGGEVEHCAAGLEEMEVGAVERWVVRGAGFGGDRRLRKMIAIE